MNDQDRKLAENKCTCGKVLSEPGDTLRGLPPYRCSLDPNCPEHGMKLGLDWDKHAEEVRPAIRELDRRNAESMARASSIPVSNADWENLDNQMHNTGKLSHIRFR